MTDPRQPQTTPPWVDADSEPDWDDHVYDDDFNLNENELDTEQFYYDDDNDIGSMTPRQRIEIARENKKLMSSLNYLDFNEDFEYSQDQDSADYSY